MSLTVFTDFQLAFAPKAWQQERASWRSVIQLNLVRSVNIILDVLAEEMAAAPSRTTSPGPGSIVTSRPTSPNIHAIPASPSADVDPDADADADTAPPLEFSHQHALLKMRLTPLRQVEADLRRRLGAGSSEVVLDSSAGRGAGGGAMNATPFDDPYPRSTRGGDLCLRTNRSWREALHTEYQTQAAGGAGSVEGSTSEHGERGRMDSATEVLAGCAGDVRELWANGVVRTMLARRKMHLEESSGL